MKVIKINEAEIRNMVVESVNRILSEGYFDSMYMHEDNDEKDNSNETNGKKDAADSSAKRRQRVISHLKDPEVDVAQYAYKLWPDKDKDAGRSYFYKCLNGEKNDSGVPYKFDDSEINRLYSMLSNNSI